MGFFRNRLSSYIVILQSSHKRQDISEAAKAAGAPEPSGIPCDLMSFKSVRAAGEQLQAEECG